MGESSLCVLRPSAQGSTSGEFALPSKDTLVSASQRPSGLSGCSVDLLVLSRCFLFTLKLCVGRRRSCLGEPSECLAEVSGSRARMSGAVQTHYLSQLTINIPRDSGVKLLLSENSFLQGRGREGTAFQWHTLGSSPGQSRNGSLRKPLLLGWAINKPSPDSV